MGELKTCKRNIREIKATTQKTVVKCKKTVIEQRRKNKHDKNKSEYDRLIKRQGKKDKEEWLGQQCEEIENHLNRGNTEKSYNFIRKLFFGGGNPK